MLIFAHTGITLGAATVVAGAARGRRFSYNGGMSWFSALASYVDIRVLIVGSMLPDIIDKPVGQVFFRDTFANGRIFSHSLLFLAVLTAAGILLYRYRRRTWMLALAAGTFMHLILDMMWLSPRTLFWPFLGFGFDRIDLSNWTWYIIRELFSVPGVYIPEMVGLLVVLWFGVLLVKRREVGAFLRYGEVS